MSAASDPLAMTTAYQDSALVAAAVRTGVADAVAEAARSADEVAAECGTDPRATLALLRALCSHGLVDASGGAYGLSEAGAVLARSHPDTIVGIVEKEWFFYSAWAGLPETVADGHARIAPWQERLREDPKQAHAFLAALDDLAARFAGELPSLAGLEGGGRLLDVGGGAGSHSAALAAHVPGLEPTVLDLPGAEPVLRELHPELAFVAGDLDEPRFGRPEGEAWDVVLLANVLHDHPPERCRRYVAEAAGLLAPGGTLLVYEWVIGDTDPQPEALAMFSLMMMVENEGGGTWTEAQITDWVLGAGLGKPSFNSGGGPITVVRADAEDLSGDAVDTGRGRGEE